MAKAPGKSHRNGISLMELADMFPDEESAIKWFEAIRWQDGRYCPHCGGTHTRSVSGRKPMPYWCRDCRSYFSVRTGTTIQNSRLPMRKWAFAVYLFVTNLKGISSMKLHRDLNVTQKTAWFMLHRLRESWASTGIKPFNGPVEVDETYVGGKEKNKRASKKLHAGRGIVGKTPVVGLKDRGTGQVTAKVVVDTRASTLQQFVTKNTAENAMVYTDDAKAYKGIPREHQSVSHSVGEYVNNMAHTNGIESFWSMLKRGHSGIYHKMSGKHLDRYVSEFVGRHNIRPLDTADQMWHVVAAMSGRQLLYKTLIS